MALSDYNPTALAARYAAERDEARADADRLAYALRVEPATRWVALAAHDALVAKR
jgi:hypothetical protein